MINPSNKFLRSREFYYTLPNSIHDIAFQIAIRTENQYAISAQELAVIFMDIVEKDASTNYDLFPQLVDQMVKDDANGEEFSKTFRTICKDVMGINPPIIIIPEQYSENINVAVDWWTQQILFRDDISNLPTLLKKYLQRSYSPEEVSIFKNTLAKLIARKLAQKGEVFLSSEWTADDILETAGNKIDINQYFGYPNADMAVYEDEVKVSTDSGKTWRSIYSK